MPLPAPGTAELLRGVPLADLRVELELTTPTGAAIATTIADRFGPLPPMTIEKIGLGAGTKDLPDHPNVLRIFVGTVAESVESDRVWVLETNLDDLPGELVGYTTSRLLEAGALDAFVTPIYMKKNRPGSMISVLCNEAKLGQMEDILFRETATLGIRRYPVSRHKLKRREAMVETPFGPIRGKLGWRDDRPPVFTPEYDDCARVAAERAVPLREVYQAAQQAHLNAGATPSASGASVAHPTIDHGHEHHHPHPGHDHGHDHPHTHDH